MPGDQTNPRLVLNRSGGYIVWQDNNTDGDGLGISARALDSSLSPVLQKTFRVNQSGAGDQGRPDVKLVDGGGAVFVWQDGGRLGDYDIYLRLLSPTGTFATGDIRVNSSTAGQQQDASVAVLLSGEILVVWSSFGQDGSMQGVFGQRFSPSGAKVGSEFQINVFTLYNQRSPAVAALGNGGFVVAWASEQQRFDRSVDIYARVFSSTGESMAGEFTVNSGTNACANPILAPHGDQGFLVAWSELDLEHVDNGWDVFLRSFDAAGVAGGAPVRINGRLKGKQYAPQLASIGTDHMVVWTSLGQDESREGVFGRFFIGGAVSGDEFRVNTTTMSQQMHPAVAADGSNRFVVAWTGFTFGGASFELFAQRFSSEDAVMKPAAPFVFALDSYSLSVNWPDLAGFTVANYELYLDGSSEPITVSGNYHVLQDLAPGTTHAIRLAYELSDGRKSAASDPATGTTWGRDYNFDGLADDWQALYWGANSASWPSPVADSDGDGASNVQEFLAGTNPADPSSVLKVRITTTAQGSRLGWDTQPRLVYQVQSSTDLKSWVDEGTPRFAVDVVDSIPVSGSGSAAYYRVIRMR